MEEILAIVTTNEKQPATGVPVFFAENNSERNRISFLLSKILSAAIHDLENGSLILVRHNGGMA